MTNQYDVMQFSSSGVQPFLAGITLNDSKRVDAYVEKSEISRIVESFEQILGSFPINCGEFLKNCQKEPKIV